MSDAKFAALLAFVGVILAPFLALIVQRLNKIVAKVEDVAVKVNGHATAQAEKIDKLHEIVTAKNAQIAQGATVQALTDVQLDVARRAP